MVGVVGDSFPVDLGNLDIFTALGTLGIRHSQLSSLRYRAHIAWVQRKEIQSLYSN